MKKSILAIAIAGALASTGAWATGQHGPSGRVNVTSGAEASVGGYVSAGGQGNQGGVALMSSSASAWNVSGAGASGSAYGPYRCLPIASLNGSTYAYSIGGTEATSRGLVIGNAHGVNSASAVQHGSASASLDIYRPGMSGHLYSSASTSGRSDAIVFGTGFSKQGNISGAFNASGIDAGYYDGRSLDTASIEGYSVGGSGVLSYGRTRGAANGDNVAQAGEYGYSDGRVAADGPRGDAVVNGWAETGSHTLAGVRRNGLAGGGTLAGAEYSASAYNLDLRRFEISKANAADRKGVLQGSFEYGNSHAQTGGSAGSSAYARAGDYFSNSSK